VKSKVLVLAGVAALAIAAVVLFLSVRASPPPREAENSAAGATTPPATTSPTTATDDMTRDPAVPFGGPAPSYPIDLDSLRAQIPDNLYWKYDAKTSDVEVAKERAERARQRNATYGRIQANEATEGEIRAYYDERRRLSNDYLQLTQLVLDGKAGEVSERDRGLFELTANLHRDRLKQIERDQADALSRLASKAAAQ
jgi:hypothetical protein